MMTVLASSSGATCSAKISAQCSAATKPGDLEMPQRHIYYSFYIRLSLAAWGRDCLLGKSGLTPKVNLYVKK